MGAAAVAVAAAPPTAKPPKAVKAKAVKVEVKTEAREGAGQPAAEEWEPAQPAGGGQPTEIDAQVRVRDACETCARRVRDVCETCARRVRDACET